MGLSRELLDQRGRVPYVLYGCQSHKMHLAVKDLLKEPRRAAVLKSCVDVLKAFRQQHALSSFLKARKIQRPSLPTDVRWGSALRSLQYYNWNWAYLAQGAASLLRINTQRSAGEPASEDHQYLVVYRVVIH